MRGTIEKHWLYTDSHRNKQKHIGFKAFAIALCAEQSKSIGCIPLAIGINKKKHWFQIVCHRNRRGTIKQTMVCLRLSSHTKNGVITFAIIIIKKKHTFYIVCHRNATKELWFYNVCYKNN